MGETRAANRLGELREHGGLSGEIQTVLDRGQIKEVDEITGGVPPECEAEERKQGDGNRIGFAGGNRSQAHGKRVWTGAQGGLGERRVGIEIGDGHQHIFWEEAGQFGEGPE